MNSEVLKMNVEKVRPKSATQPRSEMCVVCVITYWKNEPGAIWPGTLKII